MDSYKYSILNAQNNLLKQNRLLSQSSMEMECSSCQTFHEKHHVSYEKSLESLMIQSIHDKGQLELRIVHLNDMLEIQANYINQLESILGLPETGTRIPGLPAGVQKQYSYRNHPNSIGTVVSSPPKEDYSNNPWMMNEWPVDADHSPTWVNESESETRDKNTPVSQEHLLPNPSRKGKERAHPISVSQLGQHLWKTVIEDEAPGASENNTIEGVASMDECETNPVSNPPPYFFPRKETEFLIEGRPLLPDRHY